MPSSLLAFKPLPRTSTVDGNRTTEPSHSFVRTCPEAVCGKHGRDDHGIIDNCGNQIGGRRLWTFPRPAPITAEASHPVNSTQPLTYTSHMDMEMRRWRWDIR